MSNERKVESIVEIELRNNGFYDNIEFQGSDDKNIQKLLKGKKSGTGRGKPEFLIKLNGISSDLLIIECKKHEIYHASRHTRNIEEFDSLSILNAKDYAEDGVIHYMFNLINFYNVVGIAISVDDLFNLHISTFITKNNKIVRTCHSKIYNRDFYIKLLRKDDYLINEEIITNNISKELPILHNELRVKMKLSEQEKPLLISAILISLHDGIFKNSYKMCHTDEELTTYMLSRINQFLIDREIHQSKKDILMQNFSFLNINNSIKNNLKYMIDKLMFLFDQFHFENVSFDIIGSFYNEFLKYVGGDKQNLGIVLTPKHITEFFCDLANLSVNSVILDPCSGTGGFLISAMKQMIYYANDDIDLIQNIKKNNIIGIEQNTQMFSLTCCNMLLRNDGKSNIFNGSCFDKNIIEKVKKLKPTTILMNPPYSQKDALETELDFIYNALEVLDIGGELIAIVPMSTAIEQTKKKIEKRKKILDNHSLEAVFSMPDELFYPVGTVTCIMIFKAKVPNRNKKTFFAYFKDDGFEKSKIYGRYDKSKRWEKIKKEWLSIYRNKDEIHGLSIKKEIDEYSDWCCEAYIDIDYSSLTSDDFENELRKYIAFQVVNKNILREGFL